MYSLIWPPLPWTSSPLLMVYSVKAVAPKDVDVMGIFKGSMPYLAVMIVITLLFIFIPGLSTFIPNAMFT